MRSRAKSGPHFRLAGLPRFTCKQKEKRRGWDSNPRDDLTPSTRFPIALLRPTRTPLRERRTGVYQKANLLLRPLGAFRRVAGVHPVLFTALVLEGALVPHGRQLTDDPRRGVSVEVRAVRYHLGSLIGQEGGDQVQVLEPDSTW